MKIGQYQSNGPKCYGTVTSELQFSMKITTFHYVKSIGALQCMQYKPATLTISTSFPHLPRFCFRPGAYNVTLLATNPVSSYMTSKMVFILDRGHCLPPRIAIINPPAIQVIMGTSKGERFKPISAFVTCYFGQIILFSQWPNIGVYSQMAVA